MGEAGQVVKYDVTDSAIKQLSKKYATVPDISTKEGYDEVRSGLAEMRPLRTGVEKKRKFLKKEALEYGRRVDAEAKRITDLLLSIEEPYRLAKLQYDDNKEAEREAQRKNEEERRGKILMAIEGIREPVFDCANKSPAFVQGKIDQTEAVMIVPEFFEEYTALAETAKNDTILRLREIYEAALESEESAKKRAEEDARIKAENEALESERRVLEAEKEELRLKLEADQKAEAAKEAARIKKEKEDADLEAQHNKWLEAVAGVEEILEDRLLSEKVVDAIRDGRIHHLIFK